MKVLLLNGKSARQGCTFTALSEVAKELETQGIKRKSYRSVRSLSADVLAADDVGLPVIVSLMTALSIWSLIKPQKLTVYCRFSPYIMPLPTARSLPYSTVFFYAGSKNFVYKPAAAVVSARRAGTTASFDELNKYFTISDARVSSQYWNMVHGNTPDEVRLDLEGYANYAYP